MDDCTKKKLACNCAFGEKYPTIPWGKTIIGCTEDNIWCNDYIAEKCEMYADKNDMSDNKRMYYAGVDMTDWDFSFKEDDPKFIYKAFIAVCNFAEEFSGCADCPLRDKLCFSKNGDMFWDKIHRELAQEESEEAHWIPVQEHMWRMDGDEIDTWAWDSEYHNGPICEICGARPCIHCSSDWEKSQCYDISYRCSECNAHRKDKTNYCPGCGRKMKEVI